MLYTQTVAEPTLDLLRRLLAVPELSNFGLVGGTNLSLRLGHRISVDLDLFTPEPFDLLSVQQAVSKRFSQARELNARKQTLLYVIEGIKIDILLHEYAYLQPVDVIDGLRLASLPDVIGMKLGAVAGRGAKKDFWDVNALLKQYTIADMIGFYAKKYPNSDAGQVVRSLVYFDDADAQEDPYDLQNVTWPQVKKHVTNQVRSYVRGTIG